jgi:predicted MFS family arabinose efflux permease
MGDCFLLNGLSYIGVIWAIFAMRVTPRERTAEQTKAWEEFREGLKHVAHNVPIRSVMLMLFVVSLVAVPYTDMLPIVVKQVFGDNARALGWLRAAPGIGAVCGALWLATRNSATGLARVVPVATAIFGIGLVGFSFTINIGAAVALLSVAGLGLIVQMASSNTIVQTAVDNDKRGRVMSLYALAMQGPMPWGSLIAGLVTAAVGVENTFRIAGACCLLCAIVFTLRLPAWGEAGRRFTTKPELFTEELEPPAVS